MMQTYRRILLFGADGQVGWELRSALAGLGEVVALTRAECDLRNPGSLRDIMRVNAPDLVVNAAGYTTVDQAEREPEVAMDINGYAPGVIAQEAKTLGAMLIHYSTDYVFDGTKAAPYVESDSTNPLSVYGRSKLAGERAIVAADGAYLVLRVAWIFGRRRRNFLRVMMNLARQREELRVVCDQIGSPTWCGSLAAVTSKLCAQGGDALRERTGIYHCTAADHTSWHGFALALLAADPLRHEHRYQAVRPIPTSEFPTSAVRPADSRLNSMMLRKAFSFGMPSWRYQLAACFGASNWSAPA